MIRDIIDGNENVKVNTREQELLRRDFAGCFNNEGKFDLEKFRRLIGDDINIVEENQGFNFLGKSYARMIAGQETLTVIRPDEEHNAKPENRDSQNIYISGDNLDALKHLGRSYAGRVKCIYIDPPYNTSSDGFVYNDKFSFDAAGLQLKLGINQEQAEHILEMKTSSSASDSAWLTFMLPRLQLAKDLLTKDGVIFISIDDNEQANLKLLCDEVFGVENFLGTFIWKRRKIVDSRTMNGVSVDHEYIMVYGRTEIARLIGKPIDLSKYSNPDHDPRGLWMSDNMVGLATKEQRPNLHYDLIHNGINYGCPIKGWRYEPKRMQELIDNDEVIFPSDPAGRPRRKHFLGSEDQVTGFSTILDAPFNTDATLELRALFDGVDVFNFPKPVDLIKIAIKQGMGPDDTFVDFFSGSATSAQAIMQCNLEDNGHRRFILVQLPEVLGEKSAAKSLGYKTIDEVGMERIRRAAKKIAEENPLFHGDIGFKHYTLEDFDDNTIDRLYDFNPNTTINSDDLLTRFGATTVLTTWLNRDGYGLNPEVKTVKLKNYTAYLCGKHLYLLGADFYEDEMAALIDLMADPGQQFNPDVIVVFGYGMGYSSRLMLDKNIRALADARGNKISVDVRY